MLSFFRKKSVEENNQSADQTTSPTSSRNNSICDNEFKNSDALVRELGYNNLTELKETIYGEYNTNFCFISFYFSVFM